MRKSRIWIFALLAMLATTVVVSCGGGGGGGGLQPPTYNLAGMWNVTETTGTNTCGNPVGDVSTYTATVTHADGSNSATYTANGDSTTLTVSGTSITYSGPANSSCTSLTETMSLTANSTISITGTVSWTCQYTGGSCTGTNSISASKQVGPAPTITTFSPTSGAVGTTVTITGTNFSASATNNTVGFNGTTALVTGSTTTSITTSVPNGATTGSITVTVDGQTATSATNFTVGSGGGVGPAPNPTITSFNPTSGSAGTTVTITGTGFSATATNNTVKFNATAAVVSHSTTTSITTSVPNGATTGPITVMVSGLTGTSATDFTVTSNSAATPGSLDIGFGSGGKVITAIGSGNEQGSAMAIQPDGKIVVAGYSYNGANNDFAVARYNYDGTLDPTFGSGGIVTTDIMTGKNDCALAVAIQLDGKIVVAGYTNNGDDDFAVVRYNSNGMLDGGFGTAGKVVKAIGSGTDRAYAVAVDSSQNIVVAGDTWNGLNYDAVVVRFTPAGALDTAFGTSGKVVTQILAGGSDHAAALAIQTDGKIIMAGDSSNNTTSWKDVIGLVRYTSTGALDTTFGTGGIVIGDIGGGEERAYAVTIDGSNNIVVAGDVEVLHSGYYNFDFAVLRYTPAGALDSTFNAGGATPGVATTNIAIYDDDHVSGVKIDGNGKIVVSGDTFNGSDWDFAVARYKSDGTPDTGFGTGGVVTTAVGSYYDITGGLGIQSDGKIVIAGGVSKGYSLDYDFAVVRYVP